MDANISGIFMVYLETSTCKLNSWYLCILEVTVCKNPVNGNLIWKYFSSGAVNFISVSAKIRGIFPGQRNFKHKTYVTYWKNQKYIHFNVKHISYLLLFALRFICFRQASECPIPIYRETGRILKKCSVLKYQRLIWKWNCNLISKSLHSNFVLHLVKKVLLSVIEPTNYIQCYTVNMWEDTGYECRFNKG